MSVARTASGSAFPLARLRLEADLPGRSVKIPRQNSRPACTVNLGRSCAQVATLGGLTLLQFFLCITLVMVTLQRKLDGR
jgi:hypothetical protein